MREIKFRAWDDQGAMTTMRGMFLNGIGELCAYHGFTIMQFTGLLDRNGKEIYEGDILRTPHYKSGDVTHYMHHIVEWSDKYTGWFAKSTVAKHDGDGCVQLWVYAKSTGGGEVIGNIYENPDLIS